MSRQNVEIVRGFVGAADGEDLVPVMRELVERFGPDFLRDPILIYWAEDPAWRHIDPGIEWTSELPGLSQTATGPSELLEWWKELVEAWESYIYTTVELRDLGDWVLNVADIRARGRQGVDVEMRVYELARVRNEKITSYRAAVRSEGEALSAAGLQNIDAFFAGVRAISRGDLEAALRLAADDLVYLPLRSAVEGGYLGHDGVRRFVADTVETFDVFEPDYQDVRDLGERVLAIGVVHLRGRGGGVETEIPSAGIATFRNGKLTRWEDYGSRAEALKAAGLEG